MLIKEFQSQKSLLDYLMEIMPDLQVIELKRFNVPKRESQAANKLFSLWLDEKNKLTQSSLKRPSTVSLADVQGMEREGLVKMEGDKLEITSRGAEVIKTMILGDDKSAFEDDGKIIDYGTAYANCRRRGRVKTGGRTAQSKEDWVDVSVKLPQPNQPIDAEIIEEFSKKKTIVPGRALDRDPSVVVFDFWSGTAAAKILRWKPRIPSGQDGHPYTSIERKGNNWYQRMK